MKLLIFFFVPTVCFASQTYTSFDSFFLEQSCRMFLPSSKLEAMHFSKCESCSVTTQWQTTSTATKTRIRLENGVISINNKMLKLRNATSFPGEITNEDDLGIDTELFHAGSNFCLHATPLSASGSAIRHKSVYLITSKPSAKLYKLPSLFSSCHNVGTQDSRPTFLHIQYRYETENDLPVGTTLTEYKILNSKFTSTGRTIQSRFVDPENVYRFIVDK